VEPCVRERTSTFVLSAFLTAGCVVARPTDFGTPEAAVATFQSAFARDDEFAEYDCLAQSLKRAGATQQAWSLERGRLFEPFGALGRFVLRRNDLADNVIARDIRRASPLFSGLSVGSSGRVEDRAPPSIPTIDYRIFGRGLRVGFAVEPTLLLECGGATPARAFPFGPANARIAVSPIGGEGRLEVELPLPAALASELSRSGASALVVCRRYKLVLPVEIEPGDAPWSPPSAAVPPTRRRVSAPALIPVLGRTELGVTRARFALPLPPVASFDELDVDEWRFERSRD
jgi:hypothetical protein